MSQSQTETSPFPHLKLSSMTLADVEYKALLTDENYESSSADDTKGEVLRARSTWAQRYVVFWIASIVHIIITLSLALSLYYVTHTGYEGCQTSSPREALLYCNTLPFAIPFYSLTVVLAPAQEAVTYEVKNFIIGLHDGHPKTLFGAEPSYEVDEAWETLYNGEFLTNGPFMGLRVSQSSLSRRSQKRKRNYSRIKRCLFQGIQETTLSPCQFSMNCIAW